MFWVFFYVVTILRNTERNGHLLNYINLVDQTSCSNIPSGLATMAKASRQKFTSISLQCLKMKTKLPRV